MPVLFIGHGSPLNIVLENSYTRSLAAVGKSLPKLKGIMVVSAHWLTNGTFVACMIKPRTIYDFYGFPKELYDMTYPSPGAPDEVEFVTKAVRKTAVQCNQLGAGPRFLGGPQTYQSAGGHPRVRNEPRLYVQ